ncbi:MAG: two-component system, response regulator YesN [Moorella sp. (in: firmicutes)]|nr:two-component system, response regulator YesN [Moorella sp. (in: firmicutes)]
MATDVKDVKILLVDDEPLERQAIRFLLARERPGYQVVGEAGNGVEAVNQASRLQPDIIFLDIKMPVMDGLAAGQEIRALLPEARLIFVTAYGEFDYAREAVSLGASKYLLKPVAGEEMLPLLDELAAGIAAARRRLQETTRLRAALEETKPFIRLGFIMDLINGNISEDEAVSRARFLGITALPRIALLMDIDNFVTLAREGTEVERQILKQQVKEVLEGATTSWPGALLAPVTRDEFVILLPLDHLPGGEASRRAVIELGDSICRQVRRDTRVTVTVGIGRPVEKVTELARSYAEAAAAAEFRLLYGGDQVIHADDVIARSNVEQLLPGPEEQELTQAIRMGDSQAAYERVNNILMQLLLEQEKRPAILKMKLLELNALTARAALEGGADADAVSNLALASSDEFLTLDNLADMRERILERLMALVGQVAETREQRNSSLIDRAGKYIEANFSQDLPLEEVAQQVYLSPCYFSRLFKQFKGLTFIDYLTRVRLKAAKELLLNTNLPVAEIAARVGYHDARYFGQVFKKQEGYTPSVFRKIGGANYGRSVS